MKLSFQKNAASFSVLLLYLIALFLLLPITLGLFCAYFIFPIVQFGFKKLKIPYIICIALTTSLFLFILYEITMLILKSAIVFIPVIKLHLTELANDYSDLFISPLIIEKSFNFFDSIIGFLMTVAQKFFSYLFEFFIFLLVFYFSLFESRKNRLWFFVYVPKKYRVIWQPHFEHAMRVFSYFVLVTMQLFILTFTLLSIGFYLLKFENPISKAFLVSVVDVLPFFGIGIILIPLSIYFFILEQQLLALSVLLLYIFIQLTRQLIESVVWASTFQLRIVHSFMISAVSILLFGIYGLFISPFLLLIAVKIRDKTTLLH